MKILLISVFAEKTGWGKAANLFAEALNSNPEIDLVCRTITLGTDELWNETVIECHKKDLKNCDYCIQLLLPHLMEYSNTFKKCVGMFYNETDSYKFTSWSTILNLMDEVWTPYPSNAHKSSGVNSKNVVIEQPYEVKDYSSLTPLDVPVQGDFVFYTIGELNKRKNISALIKAFYTEFGFHENVKLLIKTSEPGIKSSDTATKMLEIAANIKAGLKISNRHNPEIVVTNRLSEEDMMRLHKTCHCFVSTSCGEAVCLPLLDAAAVNNFIIAPESTGTGYILDLLDAKKYKISCSKEDVFGVTDTFADLFTANEQWFVPSISDLRAKMRMTYQEWEDGCRPYWINNLQDNFSYTTISNKVIKALTSDNTNINNT